MDLNLKNISRILVAVLVLTFLSLSLLSDDVKQCEISKPKTNSTNDDNMFSEMDTMTFSFRAFKFESLERGMGMVISYSSPMLSINSNEVDNPDPKLVSSYKNYGAVMFAFLIIAAYFLLGTIAVYMQSGLNNVTRGMAISTLVFIAVAASIGTAMLDLSEIDLNLGDEGIQTCVVANAVIFSWVAFGVWTLLLIHTRMTESGEEKK